MYASSRKDDLLKQYSILFLKEVNQLRSLFLGNNCTSRFCDKFFKNLWSKIILYQIGLHQIMRKILILIGIDSKWLAYRLSKLSKRQFGIKL